MAIDFTKDRKETRKPKRVKNIEIPRGWKLPEEITHRLGSRTGKQRVISENNHVLIVLHKAPLKHDTHRKSLFLWRNDKDIWAASDQGSGFAALGEYLKTYAKLEESLDDEYEKAVNAKDFFNLLEEIAPILRAIKNTYSTLQTAREIAGEALIDARDKAEELHRNIELLYIDSKNGLDYAIAKKTEEQSELQREALVAGHRLNIIMALFFPITAVASLLGMNVPHGLENAPPWVFVSILAICIMFGIALGFMVLRKPNRNRGAS